MPIEETIENPSPEPAANSPLRTALTWIIKLGLVVGIFAWLIHKGSIKAGDLSELAGRWPWALATLALFGVSAFICTFRYQLLLRSLGVSIGFAKLFPISMIGMVFDLVAPMSGGDVVKAYYVQREAAFKDGRRDIGLVLLSVVLDRIMGFLGLFMLGLTLSILAWSEISGHERLRHLTLLMACICAGVFAGFALMVSERLENSAWRKNFMRILPFREKLERIYTGFAGLRHHKRILLGTMLLSMLNHTLICMMVLMMAQGMQFTSVATGAEAPLPVIPALTILPIGLTLNAFGFAGGFGVGNLAFEELFKLILGLNGGAKLILSLQIVGVVFKFFGIPFLLLHKHRAPLPAVSAERN